MIFTITCVEVLTHLRKSSISTIVFPSTTTIPHYSTMHLMLSRVIGAKFILYWVTICLFVDFLFLHSFQNKWNYKDFFSIKFFQKSIPFSFFIFLSHRTTIHVHRQKFNVPVYRVAMTFVCFEYVLCRKKATTKNTIPGTGINYTSFPELLFAIVCSSNACERTVDDVGKRVYTQSNLNVHNTKSYQVCVCVCVWRQLLDPLKCNINFVYRSISNTISVVLYKSCQKFLIQLTLNWLWASEWVSERLEWSSMVWSVNCQSVNMYALYAFSYFSWDKIIYTQCICTYFWFVQIRNFIYRNNGDSTSSSKSSHNWNSHTITWYYYGCVHSFVCLTCNNKTIIN